MPIHSSRPTRLAHHAMIAAVLLLTPSPMPAVAGGVTGQATEWTQLANNAELISLVGKSAEQVNNQITQISQLAEQIQNQLKIYQNMLQNTAQLPNHIWARSKATSRTCKTLSTRGRASPFRWAT